jgi:arylsulfatase A-like enzyme
LIQAKANADGRPAYRAVRTAKWLYVKYSTGERELYNLRNDPYQLRSLHASADSTLVAALDSSLRDLSGCSGAGCRRAEDTPAGP